MWWYRHRGAEGEADGNDGQAAGADALEAALAASLADRPLDPDVLLAMCLLVDSRIELESGAVLDGATPGEAEKMLGGALGDGQPLRLYNRFIGDYGEGYSRREDAPEEHRKTLDEIRGALTAADGISAVEPRSDAV